MTFDSTKEEYFPRGGFGGEIKKKRNFVFEKKGLHELKAKKPGKRERKKRSLGSEFVDNGEEKVVFERFEPLTYKSLSVGTVCLCSVREIHEKYVDISMPGRLSARLYLEDVSEPYSKILNKVDSDDKTEECVSESLQTLFRVGQHLSCSVMTVTNKGHYAVRVSSNPAQVNQQRTFDSVTPGCVLQMAVQSVEDHGYMMFSGVSGLIAFLPAAKAAAFIEKICDSKPLRVGQVVWALVTTSKITGSSNTIHVTLDFDSIYDCKLEDVSMEQLVPGTKVDVSLIKIVSQTLLVTVKGSKLNGYIEETHLSTRWSKLSDYELGSVHTATVLYKFPYAKIVAFTLKCDPTSSSTEDIKLGTIFKNAEIMCILKRGVCLKLDHNGKGYKGLVSVRRLGEHLNYDTLSTMFPIGNHISCRVIGFDALEETYSCATDDKSLNEKYVSPDDLKVGEVVDITIDSFKKAGLIASIGSLKGYVPATHISDVVLKNPFEIVQLKSKHKAKVLSLEDSKIYLTMRPTLLRTPSLIDLHRVEIGDAYFGWVNRILPDAIAVSFFGNLYSHIKENNLMEKPRSYTVGELVKCYVLSKHDERPIFSLIKSVQSMDITVGNKYLAIVTKIAPDGVACCILSKNRQTNCFLPFSHISDDPDVWEEQMKKYIVGFKISDALLFSVCGMLPLLSLRKSVYKFFQDNESLSGGVTCLKTGMLIPCSVAEVFDNRILVYVPIPGYNGNVTIQSKDLPYPPTQFTVHQNIMARVSKVDGKFKTFTLTCRLSTNEKWKWSQSHIENVLSSLRTKQTYHTGSIVECTVKHIRPNAAKVIISSSKVKGFLIGATQMNLKAKDTVEGVVLFHDIEKNIVFLHADNILREPLNPSVKESNVEGTVLCGKSSVVVALVGRPIEAQRLAFIATVDDPYCLTAKQSSSLQMFTPFSVSLRLPKHDEENGIYYWLGSVKNVSSKQYLKQKKRKSDEALEEQGLDSKSSKKSKKEKVIENSSARGFVAETMSDDQSQETKKETKLNSKKRKLAEQEKTDEAGSNDIPTPDSETSFEMVNKMKKNKKHNTEDSLELMIPPKQSKKLEAKSLEADSMKKSKGASENGHKKQIKSREVDRNKETDELSLEDVAAFEWNASESDLSKVVGAAQDVDLSEDDSEEDKAAPKKLTPAEKRAAAMEKERLIREKEEELLLAESKPESAEHFDRLLSASPNSSKLWIMYMAHHMQSTEIEKARSVAKRALKHINVRLEDERLNVWIASLNLENMFGTADSFKELLIEALKYNDDYKVHKRVLDIYAESKKLNELETLANKLVKQYKTRIDCWLECEEALMKAELYDKARKYLQRSLEVLPNKNYCTFISRFALLENKYGFPEQAQSLFENLLTSYPKRTDIWFVYIDMLTKSGSVDLARNVLERATSHKLPVRKMKALYQKWLKLEETYGSPETVEEVKEAASNYVNNLTAALN